MPQQQGNFHPQPIHQIQHIGIIPDGGRRWAIANAVSLSESYETTRKKLAGFVGKIIGLGISEISIYMSSRQNFKRQEYEIEAFTNQALLSLSTEVGIICNELGLKVSVAGKLSHQSAGFIKTVEDLINETSNHAHGRLNLCIEYDPFDEIQYALNQLNKGDELWNGLWIKQPLDIVIRSGNANLLSNFLPLQSAYARLYFSEKLFNDLTWPDIESFINDYQSLERKYGD